jgi:hypothetical protein
MNVAGKRSSRALAPIDRAASSVFSTSCWPAQCRFPRPHSDRRRQGSVCVLPSRRSNWCRLHAVAIGINRSSSYSQRVRSAATNSLNSSNTITRVFDPKPRFKTSRALRLASLSGFTNTSASKLSFPTLIRNNALECESVIGKEYPITTR